MLVFLSVNGQNNAVTYAGYGQPNWMVDHGNFITTIDDTVTGVKDLLSNVNAHTYDQIMGTSPYLTAYYDGSNVNVTAHNGSPTSATFSLFGSTYNETFTTDVSKLPVLLHASVANQRATVSIQVSGFPYIYVETGGMNADVQTQVYTDSSSVQRVVPYKNADLGAYWTNQAFPTVWQPADIATIIGILMELTTKIASTVNLYLDANQQNTLNDLINNLVPKVPVNLESAVPVPATGQTQSYNGHYSSYRTHFLDSGTAMSNYQQDVSNITAYVPLH